MTTHGDNKPGGESNPNRIMKYHEDTFSRFPSPNTPIPIFQGPAKLIHENIEITGSCWLTSSWSPYPRTEFSFESTNAPKFDHSAILSNCSLKLPGQSNAIQCSGSRISFGNQFCIDGFIESGAHSGDTSLIFFQTPIINLKSFFGKQIHVENEHYSSEIQLTHADWSLRLTSRPSHNTHFRNPDPQGFVPGYSVTHRLLAHRTNNAPFTTKDAQSLLSGLWRWCSFTQGSHCGPTLAAGFDTAGNHAWQEYSIRHVSPWSEYFNWSTFCAPEDLNDSFQSLLAALDNEDLKSPVELGSV